MKVRERVKSRFGFFSLIVVAAVALFRVAAAYIAYEQFYHPCCAPEPHRGQPFLESYNFQTSGSSSSLFAILGIFEGQGVTVSSASLDGAALTGSNSNLTTSCGAQTYGSILVY